jgi:GNAT acetyltransferase-like protein
MKDIIAPIDRNILLEELNGDRFIRTANNGPNLIYILDHNNAPNVMREIGRLRELTFRDAGGGTGEEVDIDHYDIAPIPYQQLIVWNPEDREIVGGYRFIKCADVPFNDDGILLLATTELFKFSDKFCTNFIPYTIELGRSFVQTRYQPSVQNRKGLFSLDNLWDGLGALVIDNPEIKYLFGKVTMYTSFNKGARDMILSFMQYYFPDKNQLVTPHKPLPLFNDMTEFTKQLNGLSYKEGHRVLNHAVRSLSENIPPLVNSYMNLSASMKTFGTAFNNHFGDVEETGILLTLSEIYQSKKERHLSTYSKKKLNN